MGRHTITNPATGRKVFKTSVLGRKLQKLNKTKTAKKIMSKKTVTKAKATKPTTKTSEKKKSYHGPGATKRPSPIWKPTKTGGKRPSARAMYDAGFCGPVYYNGKKHVMDFRANGSPYYRPLKCGTADCATGL